MRRIATSDEFFDILDKMGDNKFVTIGYVTGANLNVPKIKKLNPLTNRMKGYEDYSAFGDEEIGALVKISSYNMRYRKRNVVNQQYVDYKTSANGIRGEYGLDPIGDKGDSYKDRMNYGEQGVDLYKGNNDALQGHSYYPQNVHNVRPKSIIYCVGTDGHIIKALTKDQIVPYLKDAREIDGVAALRKMGVEDERIKEYISKIKALGMSYKNFEANSILWIAATVGGEKIVYINNNLSRTVNDININPQDFIAIAKERYQKDMQQLESLNMKGNLINELDWRTYYNAKMKARELADNEKRGYEKTRRKNQADAFNKHGIKMCDKQYGIDKIHDKERTSQGEYKPSQGELKRLQRQADDVYKYHQGKQEYKDGKWQDKTTNESKTNKAIFRLTESELKSFIGESVKKILSELNWKTYASAAQKAAQWRKDNPTKYDRNRGLYFRNAARDAFDKEHDLEHQYDDVERGYSKKGTINLNSLSDFSVSGSRDHDFGDGDPHGLRHNIYHMSKEYGTDGGYGRTRMWDTAHETTPEKFFGSKELGKKFRDAEKDAEDFTSGKSHYVKGKGWTTESKNSQNVDEAAFGKNGNGRISGDMFGRKLPKGGSKFAKQLMKQSQEKNKSLEECGE